jgi:hypothetical protein
MYKPYFNELKNSILNGSLSVTTVSWLNENYLETFNDDQTTKDPTCFIEFGSVNWSTSGNNHEVADATITFHLVNQSAKNWPEDIMEISEDFHDFIAFQSYLINEDYKYSSLTLKESTTSMNGIAHSVSLTYEATLHRKKPNRYTQSVEGSAAPYSVMLNA